MQRLTPDRVTEINAENIIEYKISKHAKERYAERIMNKEDMNDINRFIAGNEEKIKMDINKLIHYGEMIYTGKQSTRDGKGNVIDVYLKNTWVILVDGKSEVVVTLYKIDLGLDDEFNKTYISKMMEKLNKSKEALDIVQSEVQVESDMYKEYIDDAETQIKEYKVMIKNLEELCEGYQTIIDNNVVKVSQAKKEVADTINTLIGKREF